jgi:hypothetical protein
MASAGAKSLGDLAASSALAALLSLPLLSSACCSRRTGVSRFYNARISSSSAFG